MSDLFSSTNAQKKSKPTDNQSYTADDIEVLEGLEPVRHRPGMYIGGTDEIALHHLVSEVFDNCMDEAVAGYATFIELHMHADGSITITDDGRGIPVDPHPKFPEKSALEVIMTTLHAGGKFSNKVYETSGGLHGVGISVVNALSEKMIVEVKRGGNLYKQVFSKGNVVEKLNVIGPTKRKKESGTQVTFMPDKDIFDDGISFKPLKLYRLAKSKAYLFKGVEIRWSCDPELINKKQQVPETDVLHFPKGLEDYLTASLEDTETVANQPFCGEATFADKQGRVEWAVHWIYRRDALFQSYCNTVITPQGGSHETGLKNGLLKAIKDFAEIIGNKKASNITADDVSGSIFGILSLFIPEPQFQGQTKDKLSNRHVVKLVENAVKDHFDHWLSHNKQSAKELLGFIIERAEERLARRQTKEIARKSPVQKLRLPGKLADCTRQAPEGTEIFLVEGDSAGGSAKMARDRQTQAILPLRGKILNVASATKDKIAANQEIQDLNLALGCGVLDHYTDEDLRYEKVIIMTDADVDGAHIASLLMTYFYLFTPQLIDNGHLYLAQPPLYRITHQQKAHYVNTDQEKDKLVKALEQKRGQIEISRFKGLGEMTPSQLKETTMNIENRSLLRVTINEDAKEFAATRVNELMGKKPELRFKFITQQSEILGNDLKEKLDI